MILTVKPSDFLQGTIELPSSKSYSIRAFMIAACGGHSIILNQSDCEDAQVALSVAKAFGSKVKRLGKNNWDVIANQSNTPISHIHVGESGTVLRFVLPLAALRGQKTLITGEGTLKGRPNLFLIETLRQMGSSLRGQGQQQSIPIKIQRSNLRGGKIAIDGSLSSQFISALLITCPQLKENTQLRLTGKNLVSSDYITMTLQVLKRSGIKINNIGERKFIIKGNQSFKGLKNFTVPSDYGLAAFLMAAASLVPSEVTFTGYLKNDLIQADGQIISLLKAMNVKFKKTDRSIKIKGPFELKGGNFSLKNAPDLVPIMAVLALFAKGKTRLYDIGHARAKESDRISDLRNELLKVGAHIKETADELIISPQKNYKKNIRLDPHHDHRLAMAFCVLGLKLGVSVKDIECTAKSYPGFVRDFKLMGAKVTSARL